MESGNSSICGYMRPILRLDTGFLHLVKKSRTESVESLAGPHIASYRYLTSARAIQATSSTPEVVTAHGGSRTAVGELSHRFSVTYLPWVYSRVHNRNHTPWSLPPALK